MEGPERSGEGRLCRMNLSEMIGEEIILLIPFIEPDHYQKVKLLGVEAGGIWIESQEMMNQIFTAFGETASSRSLAFFFPYHELKFGMVPMPGMALNERAFGVEDQG